MRYEKFFPESVMETECPKLNLNIEAIQKDTSKYFKYVVKEIINQFLYNRDFAEDRLALTIKKMYNHPVLNDILASYIFDLPFWHSGEYVIHKKVHRIIRCFVAIHPSPAIA